MEGSKMESMPLPKLKDPRLEKAHAQAMALAAAAAASATTNSLSVYASSAPSMTTVDTNSTSGVAKVPPNSDDKNVAVPNKCEIKKESGSAARELASSAVVGNLDHQNSLTERRRSPSETNTNRKRRSISHDRRSLSSPSIISGRRSGRRRSPSPKSRRVRYSEYSPGRRRHYEADGGRRNRRTNKDRGRRSLSRDRRGGIGRDRYRDARDYSSSRSMSRSISPAPIRGSGRWSPKKNKNLSHQTSNRQVPMTMMNPGGAPSTHQYAVMGQHGPQPPTMYGDPVYGATPGPPYPYGIQPQQQQQPPFVPNTYGMPPQSADFNTNYPLQGNWTMDAYGQQQWIPAQMAMPQQSAQQTSQMVVPSQTMVNLNHPPHHRMMAEPINDGCNKMESTTTTTQDAVAQEAENQRTEFKKQRNGYVKKTAILRRELQTLKEQRKELHSGSAPPSPTTKGFMEENDKLQNQIEMKLSTIENVIDMLTGLIGDEIPKIDDIDDNIDGCNLTDQRKKDNSRGNDIYKNDHKGVHRSREQQARLCERDPRSSNYSRRTDDHYHKSAVSVKATDEFKGKTTTSHQYQEPTTSSGSHLEKPVLPKEKYTGMVLKVSPNENTTNMSSNVVGKSASKSIRRSSSSASSDEESSTEESTESSSTVESRNNQVKKASKTGTVSTASTVAEVRKMEEVAMNNGNAREHRRDDNRSTKISTGGVRGDSKCKTNAVTSNEHTNLKDNESADDNNYDDDDDSSAERLKNKVIESMRKKQREMAKAKVEQKKPVGEKKERFNYIFYDPEMHWCQACDIFPKTARDYLNHLHSKEHLNRVEIETPWHHEMTVDQYPNYENVPTKRTPIRGLMFFVPATAWFCKLCNIWMGDLHCASTHLKSPSHANRYNAFLEENPDYEVNWLADRQQVLNSKKFTSLPPQNTSVSTTAAEHKKIKIKEDEKISKKRRRKSEKKQKKRKKRSAKKQKRKAMNDSSGGDGSDSSSDSNSSSMDDNGGEGISKKMSKQGLEVKPIIEQQQLEKCSSLKSIQRPEMKAPSEIKSLNFPLSLPEITPDATISAQNCNVQPAATEYSNTIAVTEKACTSKEVIRALNSFQEREINRAPMSTNVNSDNNKNNFTFSEASIANTTTITGSIGGLGEKKVNKVQMKGTQALPASPVSSRDTKTSETTTPSNINISNTTIRNPFNTCSDFDKENCDRYRDRKDKVEKEVKLLKGKGKEKERDRDRDAGRDRREKSKDRGRERDRDDRGSGRNKEKDRKSDRGRDRDRGDNDRRTTRYQSRSRSCTRSRSRGPTNYRRFKRSHSRSRERKTGRVWGVRRPRGMAHSRSRTPRRRSRSYERRRRSSRSRTRSRSRSRTRSTSRSCTRSRSRSHSHSKMRSRTRSRSIAHSKSPMRIEKPVVKQPEFRPRVPEKDKDYKDKKTATDIKDKRDRSKSSYKSTSLSGNYSTTTSTTTATTLATSPSTSSNSTTAATGGKKLPFIGKMPVFKKQNTITNTSIGSNLVETNPNSTSTFSNISISSGYNNVTDNKRSEELQLQKVQQQQQKTQNAFNVLSVAMENNKPPLPPSARPPKITAAQIQMAMMEDAYGNAPPFHPDAPGMMVDYDDLMPDPVQFVNLMGQAPPPPPPSTTDKVIPREPMNQLIDKEEDDENMLPPGIDEAESDEFVAKPMMMMNNEILSASSQNTLPEDLQEALNIIFPSEKQKEIVNMSLNDKEQSTVGEASNDKIGMDDNDDEEQNSNRRGINASSLSPTVASINSNPTNLHKGSASEHILSHTRGSRFDQNSKVTKKSTGDTQIINDEPILQMAELAKEGIHLITLNHHHQLPQLQTPSVVPTMELGVADVTSSDSKLSQPLSERNSGTAVESYGESMLIKTNSLDINSVHKISVHNEEAIKATGVQEIYVTSPKITTAEDIYDPTEEELFTNSPTMNTDIKETKKQQDLNDMIAVTLPEEIPMPEETQFGESQNKNKTDRNSNLTEASVEENNLYGDLNLADIPQPPPSPTHSEKRRRQEQLEELAMLGIDADDLAAQCF